MTARRSDDGMTIIELLIAMAIMTVITAPLVTSFVLGLTTTMRTEQEVTNNSDVQTLAAFFDTDVASADSVATSSGCGGPATLVELRWVDGTARTFVAYVAGTDADAASSLGFPATVHTLTRIQCAAEAGPALSTTVVARTLAQPPALVCDSASTCTATPRRVGLRLDYYGRTAADEHLLFDFYAARRVTP